MSRRVSVVVGLVLFAVGVAFLAVTVLPFFWGAHDRPIWLNLGSMLAPIGFIIAVVGVVRAGRAERRDAVELSKPAAH